MMIPCCFHPTRVAIATNDQELQEFLDGDVIKSHMTFDYFDSPEKSLHYINEVYQPQPFYDRYTVDYQQVKQNTFPFRTQVVDTHQEIYRPQRFEEISSIVLDCSNMFSKLTLSGEEEISARIVEFVGQVKNPHIQKILLIDEKIEEIAIQALNNGQIQFYICKEEFDWKELFCDKLKEAQWQYFNKLSEIFMNKIRPGIIKEYALDDPHFQKLFKVILYNYGFKEAYLCEATGSYLFLDGKAQDHGLVVSVADQLDQWVRTAKDRGVNVSLYKALKDRKKMMCYHGSSHGIEPDKNHWEIYAHPTNTIQGRSGIYYYAFAPNLYDIDVGRVLPFEDYCEHQQRKGGKFH